MLKTTSLPNTPSVNRLVKLWAQCYTPDLSVLASEADQTSVAYALSYAASSEGRAATATKLNQRLIEIKCQMAAIETNCLYAYVPKVVNFSDAKSLAPYAFAVYKKLIEIYQESSAYTNSQTTSSLIAAINSKDVSLGTWGMPAITQVAKDIEPLLIAFQGQHIASKDWRTLGFITTLFNFSNKLMPDRLTVPEQVLIKPYFRFVEEHVALPWQRVCAAAARHQLDSVAFLLVEQMLPQALEIAQASYYRLTQLLPNHRSRRGSLEDPGIKHSCIRDLQMFQGYLWLCLLEDSMASVEHELVDLCVMVMTGVKVKWEMTELWNKVLFEEIFSRISFGQQSLLRPYSSAMEKAFSKEQLRFQIEPEETLLYSEKQEHNQFDERGSFYFPSTPRSHQH
ncbi:MAG: hypothetical protein ABI417_21145 [Coleofasciculaceae cyanobacterium]